MRIKEIKLYHFSELSDSAKDKAVSHLSDINTDSDFWFDSITDEAKELGLHITEWDLYRRSIKGSFTKPEEEVAKDIKLNHGNSCETYKTATDYLKALEELRKHDNDNKDLQDELDDEPDTESIDEEFLYSLLQDYLHMLQFDYDYATSREAIIETIEANEYEFTEEGELDS
jgi:hypothetical protein